jgi:cytochrome c oxidase subunit 1
MTMTDTPPATDAASAAPSPAAAGLYDALTTTDHKAIGRMWMKSGVLLLTGAVVLGVLIGFERLDADTVDIFGGDNAFLQMWALYRIGLALLVAMPLFIGLATVVVPMQVGSTNIAFPRAALAAVWGFVLGAGIMIASVFAGGGWGAFDRATSNERDAIALTLTGMGMVIISLLLASVCIATTVVSLRVKGMTLMRTPLFAWSMLVATAVWLLTLPVLLANLLVAYVDLHNGPGTFGGGLNGDVSIWAQVAWLVEQPQVYAFAIPALGILGSVAPVAAGVKASRHGLSMALIGLFGLVSFGAWSQPYFQFDLAANVQYDQKFIFIVFGIAAIIPVLGFIGGIGDALVRGRSNLAGLPPAHLLGALGGVLIIALGVVAGVARVIEPLELGAVVTQSGVMGTIAISGVMNLVLIGAIASAIGGFWFWAPKIGGHELPPMMGRMVTLSLLGGALLLGVGQVASGFFNTPNSPLGVVTQDSADALSIVSLIGILLVGLGTLGLMAALAKAMRSGEPGSDDPWSGQTLEWSTVGGSFTEAPARVTSETPLLDASDTPSAEGEES